MAKVYFHIDLNAFFANAECLLDPSLKGKPIAVSGTTRRSVVSTCSYEARAFGVHSAMPIGQAQQLCKDLIIVEPHYNFYQELSKQFISIVSEYASDLEQASIDECYADVTETIYRYEKPLDLAWLIQKRVLQETGIPCSIGVAPNMLLAKMASDMKKPMGITVLRIRDVKQKMWPLPIGDMRGIGNKTIPLLEDLGIHTIGDLANYKKIEDLKPIFGKNTEEMIEKVHGYDHREIISERDEKSIGVSETMLEDVTDYDEIRGLFRSLSRKLSGRLRSSLKAGKHISIRLCYYDFRNVDRSTNLTDPIFKADEIFVHAMSLFDDNWDEEALRLVGITMSDLQEDSQIMKQMNLFDERENSKEETIDILSDLNRQLGTKAFVRASSILKESN